MLTCVSGSSVSIVSGYWLLRFDPRQRTKDLSSSLCVQTGFGAHPASYTMGTGGPFPRRGREWVGAIPPLPPSAFMACNGTDFTETSTYYCFLLFAVIFTSPLQNLISQKLILISGQFKSDLWDYLLSIPRFHLSLNVLFSAQFQTLCVTKHKSTVVPIRN